MKIHRKIISRIIFALPFLTFDVSAEELKVGTPAPVVQAVNQDGKTVDFAKEYKNNKYVLVYFYPKADTPGCTAQANSLKDSYDVLHVKNGIQILGVSADEVAIQKDFKMKYKLPFDLIADEKKTVIKAFGVSTTLGFASRQAYLIKDGKIAWLDKSASTKEQAQDVIKFLNNEARESEK